MAIGSLRIGASVAALLMAVGLSAFSWAPDPSWPVPSQLADRGPTITIRAPASVPAGGTLCVEVVCYGGVPVATLEINEVIVPGTVTTTADNSVTVWCFRIPIGCSGSDALITAVGPGGQVATATVPIT